MAVELLDRPLALDVEVMSVEATAQGEDCGVTIDVSESSLATASVVKESCKREGGCIMGCPAGAPCKSGYSGE